MNFTKIFRQAYLLTIHNPLLWLFGIVLLGGFNLSLVNFAALMHNQTWKTWPLPLHLFSFDEPRQIVAVIIVVVITFAILHFLKLAFIIFSHSLIHKVDESENKENIHCRLCVHVKNNTTPLLIWWMRIMSASLITIAITAGLSFIVNSLLSQTGGNFEIALVINLLFLIVVTCVVGTWNTFTAYFITLHDLNFHAAIAAAFDLLVMRFRRIFEFIVCLSAFYTLAVLIGNAFINGWQHGFDRGEIMEVRVVFLVFFAIWFAVNNTFFNLAFLLFFDSLVKSSQNKEPLHSTEPLAEPI